MSSTRSPLPSLTMGRIHPLPGAILLALLTALWLAVATPALAAGAKWAITSVRWPMIAASASETVIASVTRGAPSQCVGASPRAIAMAAAGMVDLAVLADHHGGLEDLLEALEFTREASGGKAMIRPAPEPG